MKYTVALGGLFHDIGKLISRSDNYRKIIKAENNTHQESSKKFMIWLKENNIFKCSELLIEIVARHHESPQILPQYLVQNATDDIRPFAYIVSRGDTYSSKDRRQISEPSGYKTRPLDAVLPNMSFDEVSSNYRYKLRKLDIIEIFPRIFDKNEQEELDYIIENMLLEFKSIKYIDEKDFFEKSNDILKKYTWCLPADTTKKVSDISLYEHLRTSSSFSQCLYEYHLHNGFEEKNITSTKKDNIPFLILGIELDGYNEYIGSIKNNKKALKRLAGKVNFTKFLRKSLYKEILKKTDLVSTCKIWEVENKIYILLPNTIYYKEIVSNILIETNNNLYNIFDGNLYFNYCFVESKGEQLQNFNEILTKINSKLKQSKKNKWEKEILINPITKISNNQKPCEVCSANPIYKERECFFCNLELELSTYQEIEFDEDGVSLLPNLEKIKCISKKETKTLDDIASKTKGVDHIGILKCEIQNIDILYSYGFIDNEEDFTSISRLSTANMIFTKFFSEIMKNKINLKDSINLRDTIDTKKSSIVNVDDKNSINLENHTLIDCSDRGLTIIGPWNELPLVAKYLSLALDKLTGNNEDIKLSVAIVFQDKRSPIRQTFEKVNTQLKNALLKASGVTFFGTHITWKNLDTFLSVSDFFDEMLDKKYISQSFVYRLKNYADKMQEFGETNNTQNLIYISHIEYDISRNFKEVIPKQKYDVLCNKIRRMYLINEKEELINADKKILDKAKNKALFIKCILNYVIYKKRGEE